MSRLEQALRHIVTLGGHVRGGACAGVVLEGDSGFGKTTLIRDSAAALHDFHVISLNCASQAGAPSSPVVAGLFAESPDARADADSLSRAAAQHLERFAPCLMAVDDLQLIDELSAQILGRLVRRACPGALFLFALRRHPPALIPDHVPAVVSAILSQRQSSQVQLAKMQASDINAALHLRGIRQTSSALARRLHDYTGGAPALIEALIDELVAGGISDTAVLRPPHSVIRALHDGLRAAGAPARSLAEALAVLDTTCSLSTATATAGVRDGTRCLEPLLALGVASWKPGDVTTPISLRYPIYRDAIYASLSPSRRRALHLAAAGNSGDTRAWMHRVAATSCPDPELADGLARAAGDELMDATRAAQLLRWAAEVTSDPAARERHLIEAGRRLISARLYSELDRFRPQLDILAPSSGRNLVLGVLARAQGDLQVAERLFASVLEHPIDADADGDDVVVQAHLALASIYALQDRPDAQFRIAEQTARLPRLAASAREWVAYFLADARGRQRGEARLALAHLEGFDPGNEVAQLPSHPHSRAWLSARGVWRVQSGQFSAGMSDLRTALGRSRAEARTPSAAACLAWAQYAVGTWDSALATVDYGAQANGADDHCWKDIPLLAVQVCIDASRGNFEPANELLRRAQSVAERVPIRACHIHLALAAATLAQVQRDYEGMARAIHQIPDRARPFGEVGYHEIWWRPLEVEALIGTNQLHAAASALDTLSMLAESVICLRLPELWLAGCLAEARGDPSSAEVRYAEAVAESVGPDTLWLYRARAEQAYGEILIARRDRRAAVRWLREAAERYLLLGAGPYLNRVAAVLSASGLDGRSAASPAAGDDRLAALSDRELSVAHLVGSGLTNKEASRELFLSPKTIEYHLGNIFTKLGISSRTELRSIVRAAATAS